MKKKLLILLLTVVAALCCALCFAGCGDKHATNSGSGDKQTEQGGQTVIDSGFTFEQTGDSYTLTKYKGTDTEIVIPETYNKLPITAIGESAFSHCTSLESITIPDNLTSIGYGAFGGCKNLTSINIPDSITYIDDVAFFDCLILEKVSIIDLKAWCNIEFADSFSNPLHYAHNLYLNNNLVTEITADMLQGVSKIKDYAFYHYTNLTNITIPNNVIAIGGSAFEGCNSLERITIPDGVVSICKRAFANCDSLKSVKFENTLDWNVSIYSDMLNEKNITISDNTLKNAALLTNNSLYGGYCDYHWKRYEA